MQWFRWLVANIQSCFQDGRTFGQKRRYIWEHSPMYHLLYESEEVRYE